MKIKSTKIVDGELRLRAGKTEIVLPDGIYRRDDGGWITVKDQTITEAVVQPDLSRATPSELEVYIRELEEQLSTIGDDAQLANIDLQNALQRQQQTLQTMSNISKTLHDTALAVIRKIG